MVTALLLVVATTIAMADDRSAPATAVAVSLKTDAQRSAFWSAIHCIPFDRSAFGLRAAAQLSGVRTGFAIAPGADAKHARTYRYTTIENDTSSTGADAAVTIVSFTSAVLFKLGYAATW